MIDTTEGIPPRSKVRDVIMDRTPRPIDRAVAWAMWRELGYGVTTFENLERESLVYKNVATAMGMTHTPENAQDHYWRLLCADGVWYFQFVDYSPRAVDLSANV